MGNARAIDWTAPVYRTDTSSTLLFRDTNGMGPTRFHGVEDPLELQRGWLY